MFDKLVLFLSGFKKKTEYKFDLDNGDGSCIFAQSKTGDGAIYFKFSYIGNLQYHRISPEYLPEFKAAFDAAIKDLDASSTK